jgi:hypothetical protein
MTSNARCSWSQGLRSGLRRSRTAARGRRSQSRVVDGSAAARGHGCWTVRRRRRVAVVECGAAALCAGGGGASARRRRLGCGARSRMPDGSTAAQGRGRGVAQRPCAQAVAEHAPGARRAGGSSLRGGDNERTSCDAGWK